MAKFKKKKIQIGANHYLAEDILGKGQFGVVYYARAKGISLTGVSLPKYVAIKEYFSSRFYNPASQSNDSENYWLRETACTKLQAENPLSQLQLLDAGKSGIGDDMHYYLVLPFVEGITLKNWVTERYGKAKSLDEGEINYITSQVLLPIARHLNYCHQKGLIHRDLTIENVILRKVKRHSVVPVIIDWGAAKIRPQHELSNIPTNYINSIPTSTAFMNKGTPPEIISGLEPFPVSDVYMFGHLMYYLFSGGITCRTPAVKEDYVLHPQQENPQLSSDYDKLVEKCTQYDPLDRIDSMEKIIHILEKLEANFTPEQITHFEKPEIQMPISQKLINVQDTSKSLKEMVSTSVEQFSAQRSPENKLDPSMYVDNYQSKIYPRTYVDFFPHPYEFSPSEQLQQYANAFLAYYFSENWESLHQDQPEHYYFFFEGMGNALASKTQVIHNLENIERVYLVGALNGDLGSTKQILQYFANILQKQPSTHVIFLGNYFGGKYNLETLILILSFYCLYPKNTTVLRGGEEEAQSLHQNGTFEDLKKKFGKHFNDIFPHVVRTLGWLDLGAIIELTSKVRAFVSGGGIPQNPQSPSKSFSVKELHQEKITTLPVEFERVNINPFIQGILWGMPNELQDTPLIDSRGNFIFSWTQLQDFFAKNHLQFFFRTGKDVQETKILWNFIYNIASSTNLTNAPSIIRLTSTGMDALPLSDLGYYLKRDYNM